MKKKTLIFLVLTILLSNFNILDLTIFKPKIANAADCQIIENKNNTFDEYQKCFSNVAYEIGTKASPGGGGWIEVTNSGAKMHLIGSTDLGRPNMDFTLKQVITGRGNKDEDNNWFFFYADKYPSLAIGFLNCGANTAIVFHDSSSTELDQLRIQSPTWGANAQLTFTSAAETYIYKEFVNRAYNSDDDPTSVKPTCTGTPGTFYPKGTCPQVKYINAEDDGCIKGKWGIAYNRVDRNIGDGGECGFSFGLLSKPLCWAASMVWGLIKSAACDVVKRLSDLVI